MNKEIRNMILKDTLEELKRVKEFYKKLNVYTDYELKYINKVDLSILDNKELKELIQALNKELKEMKMIYSIEVLKHI